MVSAVRVALVAHLLALAVASTFVVAAHFGEDEHLKYAQALALGSELDARWNQEVAKLRLGIVTHYDNLVRVRDAIVEVEGRLESPPPFDAVGRHQLIGRVDAYREAVADKAALVESLKSHQALLSNSGSAFPRAVRRVLDGVPDDARYEGLKSVIGRLEREVARFTLAPSKSNGAAVECTLVELAPKGQRSGTGGGCPPMSLSIPPDLGGRLGTLVSHTSIIIDRRTMVDDLVSRIVSHPMSARAADANMAYGELHHAAATTLYERWLVVSIISTGLLACFAFEIILRLKRSAAREKQLVQLKNRFLSMTSHEFRTPLSVIASSSELLDAYGARWKPEKVTRHLHRIRDAARGMAKMLDDVLLIGRAEAGMVELRPTRLELSSFCDEIAEQMRAVNPGRTLDYRNRVPAEQVWMDTALMRIVLTNLLANAFKYSGDDQVVQFEVAKSDSSAVFVVRDQGIGIPATDRSQLFEAFHRADNALGRPGTGLGLAVVKKALEVHRGTISVDSQLGAGTRFEVRVPLWGGEYGDSTDHRG